MNQRSIILSILVIAVSVLLCSHFALSSTSSSSSKDRASEVEFRLEKLSEKEYPDVASESGIMRTIKDNLYAAKDAISSKITELTGASQLDSDSDSDHGLKTTGKIKHQATNMAAKAGDQATDVKNSAYETLQEVGAKVSDLIHGAQAQTDETVRDVKHSAKRGADTASSKAAEARDYVAANVDSTAEAAKAKLYHARDATVDAKDKTINQGNSLMSEAYLNMKEAFEALSAQMNDAKNYAVNGATNAKENLQDTINTAGNKADELKHDVKAKYQDATAHVPLTRTASVEKEDPNMFNNAYNRMKIAFEDLGNKLNFQKDGTKAELYETKEEARDKGITADWYHTMKNSFDSLGHRVNALTGRNQADPAHEVEIKLEKEFVKGSDDRDDLKSRGQLYAMMSDLYNSMTNAYQRVSGADDSSSIHNRNYKVESVDTDKNIMSDKLQDAKEYIQDLYHGTKNEAQDQYHDTKNQMKNQKHKVESVDTDKNSMRDKLQDAKEYIQDLYQGTKNEAQDQYHDTKNKVKDQHHNRKNDAKDVDVDATKPRSRTGELLDDAKERLQNVGERIAEAVGIHQKNTDAELEGECVNRGSNEDKDICLARTKTRTAAKAANAAGKAADQALHKERE